MSFQGLHAIARKNSPRQKLITGQVKFNVPKIVEDRWKTWAAKNLAQGDRKHIGTGLVTLLMGMPPELRDLLRDWGAKADRDAMIATDVDSLTEAFTGLLHALSRTRSVGKHDAGQKPMSQEAEWFIDRILDPHVMQVLKTGQRSTKVG